MLRIALLLFCTTFLTAHTYTSLSAQIRLDNWQTFSSMYDIRDVSVGRDGALWVATPGGLFRYSPQTQRFTEFRNINALKSINLGAVYVHPANDLVYAGGADGMINIYNGESWSYIGDIVAARLTRPGINDMIGQDSLLFIAGDFGLTIFNTSRQRFVESAFRLSTLPQGTGVRRLLIARGRLFAATEAGLVSIPLTTISFANPDAWTLHRTIQSGNSSDQTGIFSLVELNNVIYAGSQQTIWQLPASATNLTVFQTIESSFRSAINNTVTGLANIGNRLVASTGKELYYYTPTARIINFDEVGFDRLQGVWSASGSQLYAGTNSGLLPNTGTSIGSAILPDCPNTNQFFDLAVNPTDGTVWAATSIRNTNGRGILRYAPNDSTRWTNFTSQLYPLLNRNNYVSIHISNQDRVFSGSWGDGLAVFTPQNDRYTLQRFSRTNSGLFAIDGVNNFVVVNKMQTDDNNTTWITCFGVDSIYTMTATNQFGRFPLTRGNSQLSLIAIDGFGTKWMGGSTDGTNGLSFFNERGTPTNTSDDIRGILNSVNTGVSGIDKQNCLVVDKEFILWVGTNQGLFNSVNTGAVLSGQTPNFSRLDRLQSLQNLSINAIAVDAINRKWLGTSGGLFVITPGGDSVLAQFTTDNSPLLSNAITSLASDDDTGIMYIGSASGMNAVSNYASTPLQAFAPKLTCYPQPFTPELDNSVAIDGLAGLASVKISTIDGKQVAIIDANNSRRAGGDVRDRNGNMVPGGVYIIGAYTADGSLRASGKVLVKR